jgi:hypothetical protein
MDLSLTLGFRLLDLFGWDISGCRVIFSFLKIGGKKRLGVFPYPKQACDAPVF